MIVFLILRHEGEMYKTLLSDYDSRQKELVLENAELKKVLQQMKRDMVSILRSRNQTPKGNKHEDGVVQVGPEVYSVFPWLPLCCPQVWSFCFILFCISSQLNTL